MSANPLFKEYTADDYVEIAEQTARWVKQHEKKQKVGKTWEQSPDSSEDFSNYPVLTDKCLYGGSSGVGCFYLRMYEVTKKEEYLNEAKEAAKWILADYEGPSFYDTLKVKHEGDRLVHVKNMAGWAAGLMNGPTGQAVFILQLYKATGDKAYLDFAVKAADDLFTAAIKDEYGIHFSEQQDLVGDMSFIFLLTNIFDVTKDSKYIELAKGICDYVIHRAKPAKNGGKYYNVVDLSLIDFPKGSVWVNWAHGSAGVGFLLAAVYKYTKEEKYLSAAKDAAAYLEGIAVGDEDGVLIPYLDNEFTGPSDEFYYLSVCHGPAGTANLFHLLYKLTGDSHYLDFAVRLSRGIIKAGAPEEFSRGYWPSQALCCGTPGILQHFVSMYKLTGSNEFLEYARRTARFVIGQSHVADNPETIYRPVSYRTWYGNWWRTIPTEVHSYTGLYLGAPGNAWALLSLYGAEKGLDLFETIEFQYF